MQGGQIEPGITDFFNGSVERGKSEPANHILPAVTTRNGITSTMAGQCIIYILVYAGSAQGVLEAMAKRMKHAAWVVEPRSRL